MAANAHVEITGWPCQAALGGGVESKCGYDIGCGCNGRVSKGWGACEWQRVYALQPMRSRAEICKTNEMTNIDALGEGDTLQPCFSNHATHASCPFAAA